MADSVEVLTDVTQVTVTNPPPLNVSVTNPDPPSLTISLPGPQGPAGGAWFNGTAPPSVATGANGDYYVVTSGTGVGNVYRKSNVNTWVLQGNISGPTTITGALTTGNLTSAASGTSIQDSGIAASNVMTLSGTQTVSGTKTFSGTVTAAGFSGSGASITALNASNISTGTVAAARLGSGTASLHTFLRGDGTWQNHGTYTAPSMAATAGWLRIATLDGQTATQGANFSGVIANSGNYGALNRGMLFFSISQRGDNGISGESWVLNQDGSNTIGTLYTKQISTWVFEVWLFRVSYDATFGLRVFGSGNATINMDSQTSTDPTGLVLVPKADLQDASSLTSGTLPDARLSTSVVITSGNQTIAGTKTFTNVINANAGISGTAALFSGSVSITSGVIELGRTDGTASTPFIDFHSGATAIDYDSRIIASAGDGTTGGGAIGITARAGVNVSGAIIPTNAAAYNLGTGSLRWGTVYGTTFDGSGASLTSLNGSQITTGTVAQARVPLSASPTSATDNYSATPVGISQFETSGTTGWPVSLSTVLNVNTNANRAFQIVVEKINNSVWVRTADSAGTNGWATAGFTRLVDATNAMSIGGIKTFTAGVNIGTTGTPIVGTALSLQSDNSNSGLILNNPTAAANGVGNTFAFTSTNTGLNQAQLTSSWTDSVAGDANLIIRIRAAGAVVSRLAAHSTGISVTGDIANTGKHGFGVATTSFIAGTTITTSFTPNNQMLGTSASTSSMLQARFTNDVNGPLYVFGKSRGTTTGSFTSVGATDNLARMTFNAADGTSFVESAAILAEVDGTPATGIVPGQLKFATTDSSGGGATTRMTIKSNGIINLLGMVNVGASGAQITGRALALFGDDSDSVLNIANYTAAADGVGSTVSFRGLGDLNQVKIHSQWTGAATTDSRMVIMLRTGNSIVEAIRLQGNQVRIPGGNNLYLGSTVNGAPTFTTRSAGTKIVLYDLLGAATVDYALGIGTSEFWQSVPDSTRNFRWYAGTTGIATLSGSGGLTLSAGVVATTFTGSGAALTALNASNISTGSVPDARQGNSVVRVVFTVASQARPAGVTYVEWVGPVAPTNATVNDTWVNTGA